MRGELKITYQNDAKHTLKGHRFNFLLKWQQTDFKGISPFCKGTEDFSTPAEKESRRYSPVLLKVSWSILEASCKATYLYSVAHQTSFPPEAPGGSQVPRGRRRKGALLGPQPGHRSICATALVQPSMSPAALWDMSCEQDTGARPCDNVKSTELWV